MGCTLSKCVVHNKNFLKCTLGVDIHLKDALLQLYHDPNAVTNPLPTNGVDLFNFFNDPKRRNRLKSLLKNKKIFQDQYDLLLPQHGVVDSSLWDITLITFVGIQFLNLSATLKKIMESSRKTRNDLKHGNAEDYKYQQKFDDTMDDIEQLLIQLNYNKITDFNQLRNDNIQIDFNLLCKHHNALMQNLQTRLLQEHDTTKKELFKEILENLQNNKRKKKLHSQGTRLLRSLFKNILISLHKPTLSIDKVLTISYGKDEGEDIEIEYETLQAVDYTITVDNDEILIHITKELLSDFEYHFIVTTLQTDGTEEDNQFQFQVRDEGSSQTVTRREDILLWAYNDGLSQNAHHFAIKTPIQEDQRCRPLRAGPSIAKTVQQFRERAQKYYDDHKTLTRFPPSHYLESNFTTQFAERFERSSHFQQEDVKILTPYNPVDHLKIIGVNMKQCFEEIVTSKCQSFDNVVVTVNPGQRVVLVSVVVNQTDPQSIQTGLLQQNDILKTVYVASSDQFKNGYISIAGLLVCPKVEEKDFKTLPFLDKSFLDSSLFLLKEEWENPAAFDLKINDLLQKMTHEMKQIRPVGSKPNRNLLETLCGELMASMAQTSLYLPKVTDDVNIKIDTILLTSEQIYIINDPAIWKIIRGPFGSGKSILLHEMVRKLLKEDDNKPIYYISFDPYSLVDAKCQEAFDLLCLNENKEHLKSRIKAMSIGDALADCKNVSIEDVYSYTKPPNKTVAAVLNHLLEKDKLLKEKAGKESPTCADNIQTNPSNTMRRFRSKKFLRQQWKIKIPIICYLSMFLSMNFHKSS
eukprot:TCONS_00004983-protein